MHFPCHLRVVLIYCASLAGVCSQDFAGLPLWKCVDASVMCCFALPLFVGLALLMCTCEVLQRPAALFSQQSICAHMWLTSNMPVSLCLCRLVGLLLLCWMVVMGMLSWCLRFSRPALRAQNRLAFFCPPSHPLFFLLERGPQQRRLR